MLQTLLDSCAALGVPLTAAQAEQLCDFGARLLEQNRVMNLTAITEPQAVAKLHFADCLALLRIVPFSGKRVIDVGCGAGFPGVPLKLGEPSLDLTLLDSLGKRVTWLEATLRDMGVPAQCVCARAEDYAAKAREQYDIATSRAVARLNILAELCLPFVKPGGYFLAMKAALRPRSWRRRSAASQGWAAAWKKRRPTTSTARRAASSSSARSARHPRPIPAAMQRSSSHRCDLKER